MYTTSISSSAFVNYVKYDPTPEERAASFVAWLKTLDGNLMKFIAFLEIGYCWDSTTQMFDYLDENIDEIYEHLVK